MGALNQLPADYRHLFERYDHLGSVYPLFFEDENQHFYRSYDSIIQSVGDSAIQLDTVAVVEYLMETYLLGNRTLLTGVQRAPWLAKPAGENGEWVVAHLPRHGNRMMGASEIAIELKHRLKNEILSYLDGRDTIGVLLSGGMDSRVVASVIYELQLSRQYTGTVIAYTWGLSDCRDVSYAREIARRFKWDWVHLPLNADILKRNIEYAAEVGPEVAPAHFHALPDIASDARVDALIAGTYGDSVGRAEYSGRNVCELPALLSKRRLSLGIARTLVVKRCWDNISSDAHSYRARVPGRSEMHYREIEQQMHYLRRKLQYVMNVGVPGKAVYQAFTSPDVYEFMWSLDPRCRTDEVYTALLSLLPGNLLDLPWARTGAKYGTLSPQVDNLRRNHHSYGLWLRNELRDYVSSCILEGPLLEMNVFNEEAIRRYLRIWMADRRDVYGYFDEIFSWLASLSIFLKRYGITRASVQERLTTRDRYNALVKPYALGVYERVRRK